MTVCKGHEKWQMSIMLFAPKIYTLIHAPASETSLPITTSVAHATDFINRDE